MSTILSIMKEGEEQDNPTLFEIMKDDPDITYNEATKVQEGIRLDGEAKKGKGFKKEIDYHNTQIRTGIK